MVRRSLAACLVTLLFSSAALADTARDAPYAALLSAFYGPNRYEENGLLQSGVLLRHLILPQAAPGIVGGIILIMGQAAGSAAALLYTAGSAARVPENIMDSGRTLAVHMYSLCAEDVQPGQMYAAAVLLMAVTCIMNELASHITRRWRRGR